MQKKLASSITRNDFCVDYWTDKARASRPMFQKVRRLLEAYDGRFEVEKDQPSCEIRRQLRALREDPQGRRTHFEDFVLDYFGKTKEGEAARLVKREFAG